MTKYLFVTGGVVSSLGKGLTSAAIGWILERHGLKMVDPTTLQVVESGGIRIRPEHVHAAIRKFAKAQNTPISFQFPLSEQDIGILG